MAAITAEAPVKVNLYLHIVGRREDGYHLVDTLVAFTDFGDTVSVEPADALVLEADGPFAHELPEERDNLVLRAVHRLREEAGVKDGARIRLTKRIPIAGGVGGGSSDAATVMLAAAKLWGLAGREDMDLFAIGRELGADVPVCLFRGPAFASGIGQDLKPGPNLPEVGILLVNPGVKVSTESVFNHRRGGFSPPMAEDDDGLTTLDDLVDFLEDRANDLTETSIQLCPAIQDVLWAIEELPGCRLARMSGTGATCFGLFKDREAAETAARRIESADWWIQAAHLARPAPI